MKIILENGNSVEGEPMELLLFSKYLEKYESNKDTKENIEKQFFKFISEIHQKEENE